MIHRRLAGISLFFCALSASTAAQAQEDFKCYALLAEQTEGIVTLVSFRTADTAEEAAIELKQQGYYESNSRPQVPVSQVIECVRFSEDFSLDAANELFAKTPF